MLNLRKCIFMVNSSMPIRVFVSCPKEVSIERDIIKEVCKSVTRSSTIKDRGIIFEVSDFKDIIDSEDLVENDNIRFSGHDLYIGVLWMAFDIPSGSSDPVTGKPLESGTEEIFRFAKTIFEKETDKKIFFFFKEPRQTINSYETRQLLKIQEFQDEIEPKGWGHIFADTSDTSIFKEKVHQILNDYVREVEKKKRVQGKNDLIEEIKLNVGTSTSIDMPGMINGVTPNKKNVLHRSLSPFNIERDSMDIYFDRKPGKRLSQLVEQQSRIVLLGSAGSGKSTELADLVAFFSVKDSLLVPVFQKMNTYSDQEIENFLPENWNKIPENNCLIILDGLDEVEPSNFNTAVKRIGSFSSKFPNIRIVVSCRTNFYDFPHSISGGTLSDFNIYLFDDIDMRDIVTYANEEYKVSGEDFVSEAYDKQFKDLIIQPFFLNLLLIKYQMQGNLAISKVELLNDFVEQRFDFDQQHYIGITTVKLDRKYVMRLLRKVALTMEYMGKNYVTSDQLKKILTDPDDLQLIKFSTTFKNFESDPLMWGFEHNNIQEYLAASSLREMPVEKIKEIISFNDKLIKPSWINTLFFLMSIVHCDIRNGLIEWIVSIEEEILVKIEPDKVDEQTRFEIFKNIFNNYKEQGVWLRSNKFTSGELARFAPVEEANDFLLNELLNAKNTRFTRLNALNLIEDQQLGVNESFQTKKALLTFIFENTNEVHYFSTAANALVSLGYAQQGIIDQLMEVYGERKNQHIRFGMYKLIHKAKLESKYIDYLIEGFRISDKDPDREKTNLLDESILLGQALSAQFEIDALRKLLNFLSTEGRNRILFRLDNSHKVLISVINHSVDLYNQYPDIYKLVYNVYKQHIRVGDEKSLDIIYSFFVETKTSLQIFKVIFVDTEIPSHDKARLYKRLIDKQVVDYVVGQYKSAKLNDNELLSFYDDVKWFTGKDNVDRFLYLEEQVKANSNLLKDRVVLDMNKLRIENEERNLELFFSAEKFRKELIQFFQRHEIDELNWDLLYRSKKYDYSDKKEILDLPFSLLSDFTTGSNVTTLQDVLDFTEQTQKFDDYLFRSLKDKLSNNSNIVLNDVQIEILTTWVNDRISDTDIANAITVNKSNRNKTTFKIKAQILWFFISKFAIPINEEKILDFTTFDDVSRNTEVSLDFSVIEKQAGKDAVGIRVISNLENDIDYDNAWRNNAIYALENGLQDAYPFILKAMADHIHNYHAKEQVLKVYDKHVKESKDLLSLLHIIANDNIRWAIINLIIAKGTYNEEIRNFLTAVIENDIEPGEEKYRAAQQLTRLGDPIGTNYYLDYMLNHSDDDCDDQIDVYYDAAYLKNISDSVYLPKVMGLLKIAKTRNEKDEFDRLEIYVTEVLLNLATSSEENLKKVTDTLKLFIKENKGKIEHINFFYPFIDKLEHQFYSSQSQKGDIDTALVEVAKILSY